MESGAVMIPKRGSVGQNPLVKNAFRFWGGGAGRGSAPRNLLH